MRLIKRIIILLFIILIGLPLAVVGAALIKDETPPAYLENIDEENSESIESQIKSELEKYLMQFLMGDQKIIIEERKVNELLYRTFEGFKEQADLSPRVLWVKFGEDELSAYTLVGYRNFTTTLTLRVNVTEENKNTKISLNTMKIGKLPIPKFLVKYVANNYLDDVKFKYGEIDYNELSITILGKYLQDLLEKQLQDNLIIFDYISFKEKQFVVYCKLNPDNPQAMAFQKTIDELKEVIQDSGKLIDKLSGDDGILNLDDPVEKALSEDFQALQDLLKNPTEITSDDFEIITSIQENYTNLPEEKQEEIINIIEGSISDEIKEEFFKALQDLDVTDIDKISDLLLGGKN